MDSLHKFISLSKNIDHNNETLDLLFRDYGFFNEELLSANDLYFVLLNKSFSWKNVNFIFLDELKKELKNKKSKYIKDSLTYFSYSKILLKLIITFLIRNQCFNKKYINQNEKNVELFPNYFIPSNMPNSIKEKILIYVKDLKYISPIGSVQDISTSRDIIQIIRYLMYKNNYIVGSTISYEVCPINTIIRYWEGEGYGVYSLDFIDKIFYFRYIIERYILLPIEEPLKIIYKFYGEDIVENIFDKNTANAYNSIIKYLNLEYKNN